MKRHMLPAAALLAVLLGSAATAQAAQHEPTPLAEPAQPANIPRLFPDSVLIVSDRISVEVVGRGPDLVLIPGLASSRETWRATAERLRGRYRLHLVNVAGFAGEPARANASGAVVVPTAEAIGDYIASAHLTRTMVIGHSLGGTMALWLAENRPGAISRIMIIDALPFYGLLIGGPTATAQSVRPIAEAIRDRMLAAGGGDYRTVGRPMIQAMVSRPADVERVLDWGVASDKSVLARAFAEDVMLDLRPGLAKITTPITLLYPDNKGAAMTPAMVESLYRSAYAPSALVKPIRIDQSLHFIMYDQPQRFAAEVEAFLAGGR